MEKQSAKYTPLPNMYPVAWALGGAQRRPAHTCTQGQQGRLNDAKSTQSERFIFTPAHTRHALSLSRPLSLLLSSFSPLPRLDAGSAWNTSRPLASQPGHGLALLRLASTIPLARDDRCAPNLRQRHAHQACQPRYHRAQQQSGFTEARGKGRRRGRREAARGVCHQQQHIRHEHHVVDFKCRRAWQSCKGCAGTEATALGGKEEEEARSKECKE